MRKTFVILTTVFSLSLGAQNITWQNVNLNVPFENTQAVFNLIDGFYSNIEIPEGIRVSLWSIEYKGSSEKATHILNFAGSKENLAKFESRKLSPEWDAYLSRLNSLTDRDGFAITAGVTLVRYNLDKWQETIAQSHQWKVKNPIKSPNPALVGLIRSIALIVNNTPTLPPIAPSYFPIRLPKGGRSQEGILINHLTSLKN